MPRNRRLEGMGITRRGKRARIKVLATNIDKGRTVKLKKESFVQRSQTLLETKNNKKLTSSVRKAANTALEELIEQREIDIRLRKTALLTEKGEKRRGKEEKIKWHGVEISQQRLEIIKQLAKGKTTTSPEVDEIVSKIKALQKKIAELQE